jgi:cobalt/nickel transport system permease protein
LLRYWNRKGAHPMLHGGFFDDTRGAAKRKVIGHEGWRVGSMLLLITVASSLRGYLDVALLGVPVLFVIIRSGMSLSYVLVRLLLVVPFGLAAVILLPVASGMETWGLAVLMLMKLVLANLGLTFLMGTTPLPLFLRTLRRLKVPGPLVDMIGFTLRYVLVLADEAATMLTAQKARGLRAGSWTNIRSYRRIGQLLGVLLERSLERSQRIHLSMMSRGYHPDRPAIPEAVLRADLCHEMKEGKMLGKDGSHPCRKPVVPVSGYDPSAS